MPGSSLRSSGVLLSLCAIFAQSGCAPPLTNDTASHAALSFSCPQATQTVTKRADQSTFRTDWLGASAADTDICVSTSASGKQRERLFGRWDLSNPNLITTAEEMQTLRDAMTSVMHGDAKATSFILRGRTGEQTSQIWRLGAYEKIDVGGLNVEATRIDVQYVYAGNGSSHAGQIWFAPAYNLFVKSRIPSRPSDRRNWDVISITQQPR